MVIDVYIYVYWYIIKKMVMFVNKKDSIINYCNGGVVKNFKFF